jgi:hypothetical protein
VDLFLERYQKARSFGIERIECDRSPHELARSLKLTSAQS